MGAYLIVILKYLLNEWVGNEVVSDINFKYKNNIRTVIKI